MLTLNVVYQVEIEYLRSTLIRNPLVFMWELDLKTSSVLDDWMKKSPDTLPHMTAAIGELVVSPLYIVKLSFWHPWLASTLKTSNSNLIPGCSVPCPGLLIK